MISDLIDAFISGAVAEAATRMPPADFVAACDPSLRHRTSLRYWERIGSRAP